MNKNANTKNESSLSKSDFVAGQSVRWCPGCGDYSILANVQKVMPELNIPKENIVFVSGIGCSSRFPYYMNTYGMHTIHGRAPAFATGLKVARPELSIWIVTGDGDGLSIGGNQLLHMLRRNLDINVLLFNNRIYGLTKGQYSPTSEQGKVTKSTPFGSPDMPLNPMLFALSAGATFIARSFDVDSKGMQNIIREAAKHKGTSFVEIFQNCNIFNDGTFSTVTERSLRDDRILRLNHGEPLIFGKEKDKGIYLNGLKPEVVEGKLTGSHVGFDVWSADQPQNWLGTVRINDPQALYQPRPTGATAGRGFFAWDPVGDGNSARVLGTQGLKTMQISSAIGTVTIVTS